MGVDRYPKPRGWMRNGRGFATIPDSDTRFPKLERDSKTATRAIPKPLRLRTVEHGGQTYASVSAHDLLESEDYSHGARPGHPFG